MVAQPLFVHRDPVARLVFYGSLAAWIVSELRIRAAHHGGTGERAPQQSGPWLLVLVAAGIVLASSAASIPYARFDGWPAVAGGAALILGGIALRQWAVATLGRFFTTTLEIQPEHRVVESGPYAVVRHPSYLGGLLSMVGVGVALGSAFSVLLCLAFGLLAFGQRILIEERMLRTQLGERYARYAAGRARLIPRIW